MKLNQAQIQELYAFTRRHFVEHYDLQTELVDHLANGIEEQVAQNPKLTFKQALSIEFRKFGMHGFKDVIAKRKRAMSLKYWKIIFRFFKDYFIFPKIVATLTAILALGFFFWNIPVAYKRDVFLGVYLTLMSLVIVFVYMNMRKRKKLSHTNSKKWMLQEQIDNLGNSVNILNIISFPLIQTKFLVVTTKTPNFYIDIAFATLLVLLILMCYIMVKIIPDKAEELLAKTYPEYKLS